MMAATGLVGCSNDEDGGDGEREPIRTALTDGEVEHMCQDLCQGAEACDRLDAVGGSGCLSQCQEALMAQQFDRVAVWSCVDRLGGCADFDVCLDVPVNASCREGCARLEACGAYAYFGEIDEIHGGGLTDGGIDLLEMPPIETVCSRWCDGQVAHGDNGELEGDFACYADSLGSECNGFGLYNCGDRRVSDCDTACDRVDACSGEAPGAFGTSAACAAHCRGLEPGAQHQLMGCLGAGGGWGGEEWCDPATDPDACCPAAEPYCWCRDTTHCEELPEVPSAACTEACDDALALCAPYDRIGADLCAWSCTNLEREDESLGEHLSACTAELTECADLSGQLEGGAAWDDTIYYCLIDPPAECRAMCSAWAAACWMGPEEDAATVAEMRDICAVDCGERLGQDEAAMAYLESLDPQSADYCERVDGCVDNGICAGEAE
jgi:hypothetical protein